MMEIRIDPRDPDKGVLPNGYFMDMADEESTWYRPNGEFLATFRIDAPLGFIYLVTLADQLRAGDMERPGG